MRARLFTLLALPLVTLACSRAPASASLPSRPIQSERELLVTDIGVVNDPVRTADGGAWSFGGLMASLAGKEDRSAFTLRWLHLLEHEYVVEGARVGGRPLARRPVLRRWLARSGCSEEKSCELDFASAPFRLEAIVNRMDLRVIDSGGAIADAGEGRFVFAVEDHEPLAPGDPSETLSVIFEYALPATSVREVKEWAARWHALGALTGEDYRAALQRMTDDFARRDARKTLHHIRTSEMGEHPWELREFRFDGHEGLALESGKHNGCAGCHLDRADFEHIHSEGGASEASLSRFLLEAEIPRRQRDLDALLSPSANDARALRAGAHVD